MKNIHVLPTDKPSRLAYDFYEKFYLLSEDAQFFEFQNLVQNKELYITSNEEIKEGDWFYSTRELIEKAIINYTKEEHFGKIILTTDQDLIKDGVQAIDDEFLEWFVSKANDSGKPIDIVEVRKEKYSERFDNDKSPIGNPNTWGNRWIIIIPKEEQKQHLIDMMQKDEELGLYDETLEEAAYEYAEPYRCPATNENEYCKHDIISAFNNGAKWQAERMYSEEEVLKFTQTILMQYKFGNTDIEQMDLLRETFQLFKKK